MKGPSIHILLAVSAAIIVGSLGLAWLAGTTIVSSSLLLRAVLVCAGIIIFCGPPLLRLLWEKKQQEQFKRYLEVLCLIQASPAYSDDLPSLSRDHPWSELAEQISKTLVEQKRHLQDLEHSRTAQDIRYHRALDQAQQVRGVFASLADPILVVNDFDELLLANESAEKMFHFQSQSAEKRALQQIVHCQKLLDLLTSVRQRKSVGLRSEEIEIAGEDGQPRWYRATACKLAGGDEGTDIAAESKGVVAVLRNIGEQKAMQKRNAEFVSSVSHEMKTPLAGIKAYVEMLADGDAKDDETREEFLNVITTQADRLQRLVENMLNLARIEAGVVKVNKQPRSLNELLEEALRVVQPMAEAKKITLDSQLSSMYLGVLADRDMLLQAAINLLSNAIKYTLPGGRVTLRSRLLGDQASFEVQDTGVGLSAEDCRRVFEKFYRVKTTEETASGTGLGLPLAKHIVEDVHGGELAVESTLGEGSTFTVTLPSTGQ